MQCFDTASVWEVDRAADAFSDAICRYRHYNGLSRAAVIRNALAAVWMAGRTFQRAIDEAETWSDATNRYNTLSQKTNISKTALEHPGPAGWDGQEETIKNGTKKDVFAFRGRYRPLCRNAGKRTSAVFPSGYARR